MKKFLFGVTACIVISLVFISCSDTAGSSIIDDPAELGVPSSIRRGQPDR